MMTVDGYPDVRVFCRNCDAATEHDLRGMEMVCKCCHTIACTFHPKERTAEEVRRWLKESSDRRTEASLGPGLEAAAEVCEDRIQFLRDHGVAKGAERAGIESVLNAIRALAAPSTPAGERNYTPEELHDVALKTRLPTDFYKNNAVMNLILALERPDGWKPEQINVAPQDAIEAHPPCTGANAPAGAAPHSAAPVQAGGEPDVGWPGRYDTPTEPYENGWNDALAACFEDRANPSVGVVSGYRSHGDRKEPSVTWNVTIEELPIGTKVYAHPTPQAERQGGELTKLLAETVNECWLTINHMHDSGKDRGCEYCNVRFDAGKNLDGIVHDPECVVTKSRAYLAANGGAR